MPRQKCGKRRVDYAAIKNYMESNQKDNVNKEQERIDRLKNSVVVIRPESGYSKENNRPTNSKMPASYFTMRWVNSDQLIRNAVLSGRKIPIITTSGRTFVD